MDGNEDFFRSGAIGLQEAGFGLTARSERGVSWVVFLKHLSKFVLHVAGFVLAWTHLLMMLVKDMVLFLNRRKRRHPAAIFRDLSAGLLLCACLSIICILFLLCGELFDAKTPAADAV